MVAEIKVIGKIPDFGEVLKIQGRDFVEALEKAAAEDVEIVTLRDAAHLRILKGDKHFFSKEYDSECNFESPRTYVKEGIIYVPERRPILVSESPLLDPKRAAKAVQAYKDYRHKTHYFLNAENYVVQAEADKHKKPQDRRAFILPSREDIVIPTNRFAENELTLWAFKDIARDYGDFLRSHEVEEIKLSQWGDEVDKFDVSFAEQILFHPVSLNSGISGIHRCLGGFPCFFVLKKSENVK